MIFSQLRFRWAAAILIFLTLGLVVVRPLWMKASREIQALEPKRQHVALPANLINIYQTHRFTTRDNLSLAAWYAPSKNGKTVILLHGHSESRMQVLGEAELFRSKGYGVFLYDARAHGESGGEKVSLGPKEAIDLGSAIEWLAKRPEVNASLIGAYGFSMGAATLALEAADDPRIAAMVFASSPHSQLDISLDEGGPFTWLQAHFKLMAMMLGGVNGFALDYGKAFEHLGGRPILVIQGEQDGGVTPRQAKLIFDQAKSPKLLLLLPHSGHGKFLMSQDAVLYSQSLLSFFEKNL